MDRNMQDVPTFNCLNKPQKRALILRDQLRYLEPHHLDTFLSGITEHEPPAYHNTNGTVYPPLTPVTLSSDAARFDLGNVTFPSEGPATYHAFLTFEDSRFEMRTETALPRDEADLASVPIHAFIAENMLPLFKAKVRAIHERMERVNQARRGAWEAVRKPVRGFEEGETLARLQTQAPPSTSSTVPKHPTNKRKRVSLAAIPDSAKAASIDAAPAELKCALFNSVVRAALPGFDDLLTASWNVVAVYANVGSDFPELHRAIVQLKGALERWEGSVKGTGDGKTSTSLPKHPSEETDPERKQPPIQTDKLPRNQTPQSTPSRPHRPSSTRNTSPAQSTYASPLPTAIGPPHRSTDPDLRNPLPPSTKRSNHQGSPNYTAPDTIRERGPSGHGIAGEASGGGGDGGGGDETQPPHKHVYGGAPTHTPTPTPMPSEAPFLGSSVLGARKTGGVAPVASMIPAGDKARYADGKGK